MLKFELSGNFLKTAAAAKSLQSCPALCDPVACGLPGFFVRGVLQARVLECIGQYWLPYPAAAAKSL